MSKRKRPKKAKRVVFFVDRSVGSHFVPSALREAGAAVEIHDDHFAPDEEDTVWLSAVGKMRWAVITSDRNIRHNVLEELAVYRAGVRVFVLPRANYRGEDCAEFLVKALTKMEQFARKHSPPFFAKVYADGKVQMWIDAKKLHEELFDD